MKQIKNLELFYPDIHSNLIKYLKFQKNIYLNKFLEIFFSKTEDEQDKILFLIYLTFKKSTSYFVIFHQLQLFIDVEIKFSNGYQKSLENNLNRLFELSDKLSFYATIIKKQDDVKSKYLQQIIKICNTIIENNE